jgi:hypothetical protein
MVTHSSNLVETLLEIVHGHGGSALAVIGKPNSSDNYWVGTRYRPVQTLFEAVLRCLLVGSYERVVAFTGFGYKHLPNWSIGPSFPLGSEPMIWIVRGEAAPQASAPQSHNKLPWELNSEELLVHTTTQIERLIWRAADRTYWERLEEYIKRRDQEVQRAGSKRCALIVDYNFLIPTRDELTRRSTDEKHLALRDARVNSRLEDVIRTEFRVELHNTSVDFILFAEDRSALELLQQKRAGEPSVIAQLFAGAMNKSEWEEYKQRLESGMPHLYLGKEVKMVEAERAPHPLKGTLLKLSTGEEPLPLYDLLCQARLDHQAAPTPRTSSVSNVRELTAPEVEYFADRLRQQIIGQPLAIETVVDGLEAVAAGTQPNPQSPANFLMIGPTGTGKTEIAKLTAQTFNLPHYRIDMPNYKGEEGIWNLLGSPQGYVGGEGKLTSYVRDHPSAVLLFDEVEKADPEMYDPLLTLIDEGRLTDRRSDATIDFSRTTIFFTSNLVSDIPQEIAQDQNGLRELVFSTRYLRREFVARIQKIVPFFPLSHKELEHICKLQLESYLKQVAANRRSQAEINIENDVFKTLTDLVDTKFGARNVRSIIEQRVTPKLTRGLLSHRGELHVISLRIAGRDVEVTIE